MKMLVLESDPGLASQVTEELEAGGHTVVRCDHALDDHLACRGMDLTSECPLDGTTIDVAIVARTPGELRPSEHGALCATRQRVPVVLLGDGSTEHPFGANAWPAGDDLLATCAEAATSGAAHAAAIRRDLLALGLLDRTDLDQVDIAVRREPNRLVLRLRLDEGNPREAAIVKAAAEALRRFDRNVKVIDVTVEH